MQITSWKKNMLRQNRNKAKSLKAVLCNWKGTGDPGLGLPMSPRPPLSRSCPVQTCMTPPPTSLRTAWPPLSPHPAEASEISLVVWILEKALPKALGEGESRER